MTTRKTYTRSFKERAVKLSYQRDSMTQLASELGISPDRIRHWRKEFEQFGDASFSGNGVERLTDEQRKVKELEKQLKTRELELEILKKAIAVFSKLGRVSII